MFQVDANSGRVKTLDGKIYVFNATYNVLVQAKDRITGLTSKVWNVLMLVLVNVV